MKKAIRFLPLLFIPLLAACGGESSQSKTSEKTSSASTSTSLPVPTSSSSEPKYITKEQWGALLSFTNATLDASIFYAQRTEDGKVISQETGKQVLYIVDGQYYLEDGSSLPKETGDNFSLFLKEYEDFVPTNEFVYVDEEYRIETSYSIGATYIRTVTLNEDYSLNKINLDLVSLDEDCQYTNFPGEIAVKDVGTTVLPE